MRQITHILSAGPEDKKSSLQLVISDAFFHLQMFFPYNFLSFQVYHPSPSQEVELSKSAHTLPVDKFYLTQDSRELSANANGQRHMEHHAKAQMLKHQQSCHQ